MTQAEAFNKYNDDYCNKCSKEKECDVHITIDGSARCINYKEMVEYGKQSPKP